MVPSGSWLWRLGSLGGDGSLGLSCNENGLFLGRTALVEWYGHSYAVRPPADLERLLARAYGGEVALGRVMPGFRAVAAALDERNLCLAQIAAVHLRMHDLPDILARCCLEAEDRLIKAGRADDRLARSGWDPAEHPRAGVPPNPGWFAPTDGGTAPTQTAQSEEDERAPEEMLDPEASLRQTLWDARIAALRQIDPNNPKPRLHLQSGYGAKSGSTRSPNRQRRNRRSCRRRADRYAGKRCGCSRATWRPRSCAGLIRLFESWWTSRLQV